MVVVLRRHAKQGTDFPARMMSGSGAMQQSLTTGDGVCLRRSLGGPRRPCARPAVLSARATDLRGGSVRGPRCCRAACPHPGSGVPSPPASTGHRAGRGRGAIALGRLGAAAVHGCHRAGAGRMPGLCIRGALPHQASGEWPPARPSLSGERTCPLHGAAELADARIVGLLLKEGVCTTQEHLVWDDSSTGRSEEGHAWLPSVRKVPACMHSCAPGRRHETCARRQHQQGTIPHTCVGGS